MGLDMYLRRRTYVQNWEHNPENQKWEIQIKRGGEVYPHINPKRISYIEETAAYWRKDNQIHKWFVDNVQDGVDNCQSYYVSKESLQELLELCKQVKENPSLGSELLPTQSGFFFGDTKYDEYYMMGIDETIKQLEALLAEDNSNSEFEYQSSW